MLIEGGGLAKSLPTFLAHMGRSTLHIPMYLDLVGFVGLLPCECMWALITLESANRCVGTVTSAPDKK